MFLTLLIGCGAKNTQWAAPEQEKITLNKPAPDNPGLEVACSNPIVAEKNPNCPKVPNDPCLNWDCSDNPKNVCCIKLLSGYAYDCKYSGAGDTAEQYEKTCCGVCLNVDCTQPSNDSCCWFCKFDCNLKSNQYQCVTCPNIDCTLNPTHNCCL
ncbi:MAG: hypothetical protein AB1546_05610 [bacterium]